MVIIIIWYSNWIGLNSYCCYKLNKMQFCGILEDSHGQQNCTKRHKDQTAWQCHTAAIDSISVTVCRVFVKRSWIDPRKKSSPWGFLTTWRSFCGSELRQLTSSIQSKKDPHRFSFDISNSQVISNQTSGNLKWKLIFLLHNYLLKLFIANLVFLLNFI